MALLPIVSFSTALETEHFFRRDIIGGCGVSQTKESTKNTEKFIKTEQKAQPRRFPQAFYEHLGTQPTLTHHTPQHNLLKYSFRLSLPTMTIPPARPLKSILPHNPTRHGSEMPLTIPRVNYQAAPLPWYINPRR
jgi:hypothetical protein